MHWSLLVLIGAAMNAGINFGYKTLTGKSDIYFIAACISAITAVSLLTYSIGTKGAQQVTGIFTDWTSPLIIIGMGIGSALVMWFFINALTNGPLTLVDPMWACIYTLVSAVIGMGVLRESPSLTSLGGVALYLIGAFLMARG